MSHSELIKALPELLKQGMEVYKTLKKDMSQALGLKQYAEQMSNIVKTFKEINKHIDDNEKAILEKLTAAHDPAQEDLDNLSSSDGDKGTKQRVSSRTQPVGSRDGPGKKMWAASILFRLRERHGRENEGSGRCATQHTSGGAKRIAVDCG